MTTPRQRLGDGGERMAERHLESLGWTVLARKWRGSSGEMDLVADAGDLVVFVEVKTRRGESHGRAEEAVSPAKCGRLILLGQQFLATDETLVDRFWRVDLIAITLGRDGSVIRVNHIEDVCRDE